MNGKSLKDTVIAVVDTGVDHTLADLNSRVQSEAGYNYIERSSNVKDDNGHGTHVSGIIAAAANNHYSMAGINPFAKILPVKVLDAAGSGDTEQIAHGIIYAADHGAKVINLSLGGSYSRVIEYALQYANKKNVTVVAASGNDGMEELSYPASSKYVVSVGGTNRLDLVSDYSNYGKGLDMVAPGTDIPSLVPDGNVTYMSGTSMAAPHVSAVAGLLLSQNPNLKPNEVEKLLTDTTKDIAFEEQDNPLPEEADVPIADVPIDDFPIKEEPVEPPVPGYDKVSGWGRLNAYGAASVLELNAKINPVLDIHSSVTGKAKSGSDVKVMSGNKVLGTGKANQSGDFSVKIPVQKTDQLLHVNVANQLAETTIRTVVEKAPEKPKVNRLTNNDTHVTGKVSPGLTVNVKDAAKKVIATAKADSTGSFKVKINKQKENTVLYVTTLDGYKESGEVKVTVIDVIAPGAPKVNTIGDKDIKITGKAEANAVVTAKVKGKVIGSAQANHKGDYQLKISKQKAGTVISVTAKDKAGNTSKEAKTTVKDKTAPSAPKVNAVYSKSTTVKGKTEANASVTVKAGNKTVGSGKANSKGGFSIKIKKQKANTKLSVTAKDKAGNTGSATKITVKKSK
jgi:cell wall-associated protease